MKPSELARIVAILIAALGLNLIGVTNVFAYNEQGIFTAWGDASCGKFTEELKTGEGAVASNKMYIQGFVTGINATVPGNSDFFAGTDLASRFNFVAKYCEENPLSTLTGGLAEMVKKITGKNMQHLSPQPVQKPKHEM